MSHAIVGTAGHIDHGKTSLVRILTGIDLDRTPEEKARGITIELGFAACPLPDGRRVAIVDVPGHERLVRTMIAGASGLDAVMLVVSAVDGVMPQTREHLAILDLLGVHQGVVVLTKVDLVEPDLLELAVLDIEELVRGTFLEGRPVLPFSAVQGTGRDAILAALAAVRPTVHGTGGGFRLPIDRVFVRTGFGVVATGTSAGAPLKDGSAVRLEPLGRPARVRGAQVHGQPVDLVQPGQRAALNLAGLDAEEVGRGHVVVSGPVAVTQVIDLVYRHLPGAPDLEDGLSVRVLQGTTEVVGRLVTTSGRMEPGASIVAQVRTDQPLVVWPGDRVVLRRTSPVETLGGGTVIDPWAPRLRAAHRDTHHDEVTRLAAGDTTVWLDRAGPAGLPLTAWKDRTGTTPPVTLGDTAGTAIWLDDHVAAVLTELNQFHLRQPLALAAPSRELCRGTLRALSERAWEALVARIVDQGLARAEGKGLAAVGHRVQLDPAQIATRARLVLAFQAAGAGGLDSKDLAALELPGDLPGLVRLLEADGEVEPMAGLGWVHAAARDAVLAGVRAHFASASEMTAGQFKEISGLARRGAIPWLEWLDRSRYTRRQGDNRLAGPLLGG